MPRRETWNIQAFKLEDGVSPSRLGRLFGRKGTPEKWRGIIFDAAGREVVGLWPIDGTSAEEVFEKAKSEIDLYTLQKRDPYKDSQHFVYRPPVRFY